MGIKYLDSNAASDGSGDSELSPRKYLSGVSLTNTNHTLLFKCGSDFNAQAQIVNAGGETNRLVISSYGSGPAPIVRCSTVDSGAAGWYEVNPSHILAGTGMYLQSGSKLWWKANIMNRLLLGTEKRWAAQKDANDAFGTGAGRTVPTGPYQSSFKNGNGANTDVPGGSTWGCLLWSDGNPWDYYGTILRSPFDWTVGGGVFSITGTSGGIEVFGVDFKDAMMYPVYYDFSIQTARVDTIRYYENTHQNTMGQISFGFGAVANPGTKEFLMLDNLGRNLGHGGLHCWGPAGYRAIFNNTKVQRNVISGACEVMSLGGLYLLNMGVDDGPRIDVSRNTVSDCAPDNIWTDGYCIYGDYRLSSAHVHHNFVYGSKYSYRFNGAIGAVELDHNVGLANAQSLSFCGSNNPNGMVVPCQINAHHNIGIGYPKFYDTNGLVSGSTVKIHHNISKGNGTDVAVDCLDPVGHTVDRNNFYGHTWQWRDYDAGSPNISASAINQIATDPTALLNQYIIQNPTDPTVNYALSLPAWYSWDTVPEIRSADCLNPATSA